MKTRIFVKPYTVQKLITKYPDFIIIAVLKKYAFWYCKIKENFLNV